MELDYEKISHEIVTALIHYPNLAQQRVVMEILQSRIQPLLDEHPLLLKLEEAARIIFHEGREEALDDSGNSYPWDKWLVYHKNEQKLFYALAALEKFREAK